MPDPFDIYVDTYQVSTTPFAGTINFMVTSAMPPMPGTPPKTDQLGSVRLSLENMKVLAFFLYRQIKQHESTLGVKIDVPRQVLNTLQIGPEDWEGFWKRSSEP